MEELINEYIEQNPLFDFGKVNELFEIFSITYLDLPKKHLISIIELTEKHKCEKIDTLKYYENVKENKYIKDSMVNEAEQTIKNCQITIKKLKAMI